MPLKSRPTIVLNGKTYDAAQLSQKLHKHRSKGMSYENYHKHYVVPHTKRLLTDAETTSIFHKTGRIHNSTEHHGVTAADFVSRRQHEKPKIKTAARVKSIAASFDTIAKRFAKDPSGMEGRLSEKGSRMMDAFAKKLALMVKSNVMDSYAMHRFMEEITKAGYGFLDEYEVELHSGQHSGVSATLLKQLDAIKNYNGPSYAKMDAKKRRHRQK